MSETVIVQIIEFSMSTQCRSIWHINWTLSDATTQGQSWPRSDGNEAVLRIHQGFSNTGTSPLDCLVLYPGHSLKGLTPLQRSSRCILLPQATGQPKLRDAHWESNPRTKVWHPSLLTKTPHDVTMWIGGEVIICTPSNFINI